MAFTALVNAARCSTARFTRSSRHRMCRSNRTSMFMHVGDAQSGQPKLLTARGTALLFSRLLPQLTRTISLRSPEPAGVSSPELAGVSCPCLISHLPQAPRSALAPTSRGRGFLDTHTGALNHLIKIQRNNLSWPRAYLPACVALCCAGGGHQALVDEEFAPYLLTLNPLPTRSIPCTCVSSDVRPSGASLAPLLTHSMLHHMLRILRQATTAGPHLFRTTSHLAGIILKGIPGTSANAPEHWCISLGLGA